MAFPKPFQIFIRQDAVKITNIKPLENVGLTVAKTTEARCKDSSVWVR